MLGVRIVLSPGDRTILSPEPAPEMERCELACFVVESIIARHWQTLQGRRKDYITAPKRNGYQSLHVAAVLEGGVDAADDVDDSGDALIEGRDKDPVICETQIRTLAMHSAAERGDAAHFGYKGGLDKRQAASLKQWTAALEAVRVYLACSPCAFTELSTSIHLMYLQSLPAD